MKSETLQDLCESIIIENGVSIETGTYVTKSDLVGVLMEKLPPDQSKTTKREVEAMLKWIFKGITPIVETVQNYIVGGADTEKRVYTLNPWYLVFPSQLLTRQMILGTDALFPKKVIKLAQGYANMMRKLDEERVLGRLLLILSKGPDAKFYHSLLSDAVSSPPKIIVPTFEMEETEVKARRFVNKVYELLGIEYRVNFSHTLEFLLTVGHNLNPETIVEQVDDLLSKLLDAPEYWRNKTVS